MTEPGGSPPEFGGAPVRATTAIDVWVTVLCWVAFVGGAVFVPARSIVLGVVAGVTLFGTPLAESARDEVGRDFLIGSVSASATAIGIVTITLIFLARGRRLDSGWVAGALATGAAAVLWTLVALHPTLSG